MNYATVNGIKVVNANVVTDYGTPVRKAIFVSPFRNSFDVGTQVEINFETALGNVKMFTGSVKAVKRSRPDNLYSFTAEDKLCQAVEYWFAPANVDEGWRKWNIIHYDLVDAILAEAGITGAGFVNDWGDPADINPYTGEARGTFTFATGDEPVEIKISSGWDVISWICTITGSYVYADRDGIVHLALIWDEPLTPWMTLTVGSGGQLTLVEYSRSDENLRNKVVVYGADNCRAEASLASPYLPANFFKTAIISHELINADMAQETADINLHRLNKLTEFVTCDMLGQPSMDIGQTVEIVDAKAEVSGNWFVSNVIQKMDSSGYTTRITGKK